MKEPKTILTPEARKWHQTVFRVSRYIENVLELPNYGGAGMNTYRRDRAFGEHSKIYLYADLILKRAISHALPEEADPKEYCEELFGVKQDRMKELQQQLAQMSEDDKQDLRDQLGNMRLL